MSLEIRITDAREELLPQIQRIEQQSFTVPWTEAMLRMQLQPDSHVFLTAETPAGVVGYVGMLYVLDEGYISNVAVRPDQRRQGIADALLNELEVRARTLRLSFLTLEVRESNAAAVALYEKRGYRIAGRRKNYYEKPTEDALLMTLTLE
jgi:ribosomal-protein-alanine N-acetyltransferase